MVVTDLTCFEESPPAVLTPATASLLRSSSPPKDGRKKDKHQCNEAKCDHHQLVDYHSLPNFLKHNEFILGYYRSEWPLKQTILSVFAIHNETLNIWTHLIGFFIFLALTTFTVMMVNPTDPRAPTPALQHSAGVHLNLTARPPSNFNLSHHSLLRHLAAFIVPPIQSNQNGGAVEPRQVAALPVTRWPFYAYLCGAMFCLLMSSACHLLSCHSEHTCYFMLRLDFAGISALIVTSFYPVVYYSFACDPFFRNLYIGFITIFGIATVLVSLLPVFATPEFRIVRAVLFAGMGVSGLVPLLHKLYVFGDRQEAVITAGYEVVMGVFYVLGVVVYAARIPERWMPGRFDLAGHSHQLFHVLVIAGAYTHYHAGLVYLSWRESEGC